MWKWLRIFILMVILGVLAQATWMDKADLSWKNNFYIAIYPINADGSTQAQQYIAQLKNQDFAAMEDFFLREAGRYGVNLRQPVVVQLGQEIKMIPPAPPAGGGLIPTVLWSLKFRYFAWKNSPKTAVNPDIRLYCLYYNPAENSNLSHSTALNKGRIGRVNLFGAREYHQQNLVVTAHELLHTLNATDKYSFGDNMPIYPEGYAEPEKKPLYPQTQAELMGGRTPKSAYEADTPASLHSVVIGEKTAHEIGWIKR